METINPYSFAIFDCDGVILESNRVKSEAFALALAHEEPSIVKEFVRYHQENGGVSRYIKFEHFYKSIKKQKQYQNELEDTLKRYAKLSKKGLLECSEIPGVRTVLEKFQALRIPCYVASGGDQKEVREVLESRDLAKFFDGIYGSPLSKEDHLAELKAKGKLQGKGIFFGDARSDMEAALKYNLDFVYISGVSEWKDGMSTCHRMNIASYVDFTHY